MEFSRKQKNVVQHILHEKGFFTLLSGAIRSGKSYCGMIGFILYTQGIGPSRVNIIAGRNLRVMQLELLPSIENFVTSLGGSYNYIRTDSVIIINGVKYLVVAGHDEDSSKRVQSMTGGSAFIDEIQLVPESFLLQIIARLTFTDSKLISTCNPEGRTHWLKKDYIDKDKIHYLENFRLDDNLTISEEVKERYDELFTGVFYDRNILGEWVQAEGVIYKNFVEEIVEINPNKINYCDVGVDYGIKSVTAYQMLTYLRDGRCVITDTYRYEGRERVKTDRELVKELEKFIGTNRVRNVYVDPSASSYIAELRRKAYRFRVIEADNKVLPGIKTVLNGFNSQKLIVQKNRNNSPLVDELLTYAWDKGEDDKPVKEEDHHCDALRYAYYTRNKIIRRTVVKLSKGL